MANENLKRHGDVPLLRIPKEQAERLIAEAQADEMKRVSGRIVLAYGETSGHMHVIEDERVSAFPTRLGDVIIVPIGGDIEVKHIDQSGALTGEHKTVMLDASQTEEAYWLRIKQREFTLQGNRDVRD